MKANIYALADPNTHQVRYVGGWRHHSMVNHDGTIDRREYPPEVKDWITGLLPLTPIYVHLEEIRLDDESYDEDEARARAAEQKWLGWFAESPLLGGPTAGEESGTHD